MWHSYTVKSAGWSSLSSGEHTPRMRPVHNGHHVRWNYNYKHQNALQYLTLHTKGSSSQVNNATTHTLLTWVCCYFLTNSEMKRLIMLATNVKWINRPDTTFFTLLFILHCLKRYSRFQKLTDHSKWFSNGQSGAMRLTVYADHTWLKIWPYGWIQFADLSIQSMQKWEMR